MKINNISSINLYNNQISFNGKKRNNNWFKSPLVDINTDFLDLNSEKTRKSSELNEKSKKYFFESLKIQEEGNKLISEARLKHKDAEKLIKESISQIKSSLKNSDEFREGTVIFTAKNGKRTAVDYANFEEGIAILKINIDNQDGTKDVISFYPADDLPDGLMFRYNNKKNNPNFISDNETAYDDELFIKAILKNRIDKIQLSKFSSDNYESFDREYSYNYNSGNISEISLGFEWQFYKAKRDKIFVYKDFSNKTNLIEATLAEKTDGYNYWDKKIFQFMEDFIKIKSDSTYNIKDETETVNNEFVLDKNGNLLRLEKQYDYTGFNDGDEFIVSAVVYRFNKNGIISSVQKF